MILVTGGTGTTGQYILKELSAAGARVRSLVRNRGKARQLPGVEVFEGDLSNPETLPRAFDDVQSALLLSSPTPDQTAIQHNFVQAAKQAGLGHLVKLSAIGASLDSPVRFLRQHGQTEKEIEDAGIPFTFLRPNQFMQNFFAFADTIKAQGAFYAPIGEHRVSLVDVRDIAAVAAKTLVEPGHTGQRYLITGPAAITHSEAAAAFSKVLGKPVRYVDVPPEAARQGMLASGMPKFAVDGVMELNEMYRRGEAAMVTDVVEKIGKKRPTTFEQFVADHASVFQG
jgi:uncharacterized protein YbjT (DUF2867 family)